MKIIHLAGKSFRSAQRARICFAFTVAVAVACLPAAAFAQTTISHSTPAVNNPAAPTTVPPASSPSPVPAPQAAPATGSLKGSLVSNDGVPTNTNNFTGGVVITGVRRDSGETFTAKSDPAYGGLFTVDHLSPGVYDVTVPASYIGSTPYTAEQINDVTVTAGQSTALNITVYPGTRQLTTGAAGSIAVPVAQQLAMDDQYIHQLELQMDSLRTQLQQLQAQVTALQSRTASR